MLDDGLPPLRDVIAQNRLSARKSLGQNFLLDLNLTRRIARVAGDIQNCDVIEIGPGPGGLTRALLMEGARRVIAVERDDRCLPALEQISNAYPARLEIIQGDALTTNLVGMAQSPVRIVANLPYNIGTALLTGWLESDSWPPWFTSLTLMFQREVALRLVATPGSKAYGRLSVLAQWRSRSDIAFDVNPKAFTPPPSVTSSVVHLVPTEPVMDVHPGDLSRVTAAGFGQRRKMLRQSLKSLQVPVAELLDGTNIVETARAEELSVEDFCRLAARFKALRAAP